MDAAASAEDLMTPLTMTPAAPARAAAAPLPLALSASSLITPDLEWLAWIARFRFVVADDLASRFGVSARRARKRVERMVDAGLLVRDAAGARHEPHLLFLSSRGAAVLGVPRRKAPTRHAIAHERAIAHWVTDLEQGAARHGEAGSARILTERECRQAEAREIDRFSVAVTGSDSRRWPDVAFERPGQGRVAYELEFTAKSTPRLRSILKGYRDSPVYAQVGYLVLTPAHGARIIQLAYSVGASSRVGVAPWRGLDFATARAIQEAIDVAIAATHHIHGIR